jgi:hypothetical protein
VRLNIRAGLNFRPTELGRETPRKVFTFLLLAGLFFLGAYTFAQFVVKDDMKGLAYIALGCLGSVFVVAILKNWRQGVYFLFTWLLFEDFARKMLGNNMAIYFAKDILLLVVYIAFIAALSRKTVKTIRPPFLVPMLLLVWFGIMQVFNPASTTLLFGILGIKLFFSYMPLFFLGYALLNSESDVRRFFQINTILILIIASLGIAQSIIGPTFLNPAKPAAEIKDLSTLYRMSPETGLISYRPTSVFVSTGRYGNFIIIAWLLILAFSGYLLMRQRKGRNLAFVTLAVLAGAILLGGSRGLFMWTAGSVAVIGAAFIWGVPKSGGEVVRMLRAMQRSILAIGAAVMLLMFIYPEALLSRLAIYSETLNPNSAHSELGFRSWEYPLKNFLGAFAYDRWPYGYGIGTSSLGVQYVASIFHERVPGVGMESGFGNLVVEMGIGGLILWLFLAVSIQRSAWKVVKKLKGSPWFPIGFGIFWYAFLLLIPITFTSMVAYQDFVMNAYLWLLLGILFRLPDLKLSAQFANVEAVAPRFRMQ